ncbi:MAG: diaminopimelate epimerase [Polyangiaceae bacterium]|nr:diaminopimelate epimerase [Polyangiaceae bacterium]
MPLTFTKYEGLGNDFIVVDGHEADVTPEIARALCDRNFGIGGDGVLLVLPARDPGARARMLVLNADGSRPQMCGNGLRCVALHLALADEASQIVYSIETDSGTRRAEVARNGNRAEVKLGMGVAQMLGERRLQVDRGQCSFLEVSVGNPHAVTFEPGFDLVAIDRIAPLVSSKIEGGANIEFVVQKDASHLDLVVWERGVGRTLACGTGAAAAAAAAAVSGRIAFDQPVEVRLPGGPLELTVHQGSLEVDLKGPARRVFQGEIAVPSF